MAVPDSRFYQYYTSRSPRMIYDSKNPIDFYREAMWMEPEETAEVRIARMAAQKKKAEEIAAYNEYDQEGD